MRTNEVIARLDAAVSALRDVSVSALPEESLRAQLGELSVALCAVDSALARVADEVRARGLRIEEPAGATDPACRRADTGPELLVTA